MATRSIAKSMIQKQNVYRSTLSKTNKHHLSMVNHNQNSNICIKNEKGFYSGSALAENKSYLNSSFRRSTKFDTRSQIQSDLRQDCLSDQQQSCAQLNIISLNSQTKQNMSISIFKKSQVKTQNQINQAQSKKSSSDLDQQNNLSKATKQSIIIKKTTSFFIEDQSEQFSMLSEHKDQIFIILIGLILLAFVFLEQSNKQVSDFIFIPIKRLLQFNKK